MRLAMPEVPIVGERNCSSLRNILMPSILPRRTMFSSVGSHKCSAKRCVVCRVHLVECNSFTSDQTGETFHIRDSMYCKSTHVIYLLYCAKCKDQQYVGETGQTLTARIVGTYFLLAVVILAPLLFCDFYYHFSCVSMHILFFICKLDWSSVAL